MDISIKSLFLFKKQHLKLIYWILKDSIVRLRKKVVFVIILGKVSVLIQASSFVLLIFLLRKLNSGKTDFNILNIYQFTLNPENITAFIILFSLGIFFLLFFSELGIYISRIRTLNLGKIYNIICSKRILQLLGSNEAFNKIVVKNNLIQNKNVLRSGMKDARICGIAFRKILDSFIPMLTVIFAFSALIFLNFKLTIFVIIIMTAYIAFQAKIGRKAARFTVENERIIPLARKKYADLISHYQFLSPFDQDFFIDINEPFNTGPLQTSMKSYIGRLATIAETRFLTGVFSAFAFVIIFIVMFLGYNGKQVDWGVIITYLIALRFAMFNLKTLFVQITTLNRLYPSIYRYYNFISSFGHNSSLNHKSPETLDKPEYFTIKSDKMEFRGSQERLDLNTGSILALISPYKLDRYTTGRILSLLFDTKSGNWENYVKTTKFVTKKNILPCKTLRQIFMVQEGNGWEVIDLEDSILERIREELTNDLDREIDPSQWNQIPPDLILILSLVHSINSNGLLLFIEGSDLALLEKQYYALIRKLSKKCVVVVNHEANFEYVFSFSEDHIAVIDFESSLGIGSRDWFNSNRELIKKYYTYKNIIRTNDLDDLEDEEDFE